MWLQIIFDQRNSVLALGHVTNVTIFLKETAASGWGSRYVTIEARQIEDFRDFFGFSILLKKDSDDACTFQLTRLLSVSPQFMQYAESSIEYKGHDGSPSS